MTGDGLKEVNRASGSRKVWGYHRIRMRNGRHGFGLLISAACKNLNAPQHLLFFQCYFLGY